jgi:hypothetical protein
MKKILFVFIALCLSSSLLRAQDEEREEEEKKGFKKENLFTGGSISLAFYNNTFLIGASPVFGYSIAKWIDAGLVGNYNYTSYRDVSVFDDKLRQSVYGGGAFMKLYPVRFLFAQAQFEHNFIRQKYMPPSGGTSQVTTTDASSFLIGAGYTTSRDPESGQPFFYLAVLFDILRNDYSPYTDAYGRTIPIIRAGIQVPLFQGGNRRGF